MVAQNKLELSAQVLHMYGGVIHVLEFTILNKLLVLN